MFGQNFGFGQQRTPDVGCMLRHRWLPHEFFRLKRFGSCEIKATKWRQRWRLVEECCGHLCDIRQIFLQELYAGFSRNLSYERDTQSQICVEAFSPSASYGVPAHGLGAGRIPESTVSGRCSMLGIAFASPSLRIRPQDAVCRKCKGMGGTDVRHCCPAADETREKTEKKEKKKRSERDSEKREKREERDPHTEGKMWTCSSYVGEMQQPLLQCSGTRAL